jgi:hypothetical protein
MRLDLIAIVAALVIVSCTGSDDSSHLDAGEAKALVAAQMYQDDLKEYEVISSQITSAAILVQLPKPVRPNVGGWTAVQLIGGEWWVETLGAIWEVSSRTIPVTRIGITSDYDWPGTPVAPTSTAVPAPTTTPVASPLTLPLAVGQLVVIATQGAAYVEGWGTMENCIRHPPPTPTEGDSALRAESRLSLHNLRFGTRLYQDEPGRIVELKPECGGSDQGLVKVEVVSGDLLWINWSNVEAR